MKPILITSGEPAGIGPDICLALAREAWPVVILADMHLLEARAKCLGLNIEFIDYLAHSKSPSPEALEFCPNRLWVYPISCRVEVRAGMLNVLNSVYVLDMLKLAVQSCQEGEFSALVTAPVNKAIINEAGFPFTGHTEFFADFFQTKTVVMMLASKLMKVALITTHLPLKKVAEHITTEKISEVILELNRSLKEDFGCLEPQIYVAGLNPHAGEEGHLGLEELQIIIPALNKLKEQGLKVHGPFPADTLFNQTYLKRASCFVAMYHDQGLPVLKYSSFGEAVNITLGLPIIRTSVDHGSALELAGKGEAKASSLIAAVKMAKEMALNKKSA